MFMLVQCGDKHIIERTHYGRNCDDIPAIYLRPVDKCHINMWRGSTIAACHAYGQ